MSKRLPARERILRVALRELVKRGHEAASTNAIAAAAGVAKGLVFHYFGTKDGLYLAVHDAQLERLQAAAFGADADAPLPTDLFERLHALAVRKLRAFQDDPLAYQFLVAAAADPPPSLRAALARRRDALAGDGWRRILDGIDTSRLRPGLDLAAAVETVTILSDGLERRVFPRLAALPDRGASQLAAITAELWAHFARLRDGLYGDAPVQSTTGPGQP